MGKLVDNTDTEQSLRHLHPSSSANAENATGERDENEVLKKVNSNNEDFQWRCSLCGTNVMTSLDEIVTHCQSAAHKSNYQSFEEHSFTNDDGFNDSCSSSTYFHDDRNESYIVRQMKLQDRLDECRAIQGKWAQQQRFVDRVDACRALQHRIVRLEQQQQQWHVNHTLMLSLLESPSNNGEHLFQGAVRLLENYERCQRAEEVTEAMTYDDYSIHSSFQGSIMSSVGFSLPSNNHTPASTVVTTNDEKARSLDCIRMLAFF